MYKLAKVIARALIVTGFCSMIYVFAIQTRYLQPDYCVPHPEVGRTAPLMFKGIVRYLTPDERAIFQYGFLFGISVAAIGALLGHTLERRAFLTRELFIVIAFLALAAYIALHPS